MILQDASSIRSRYHYLKMEVLLEFTIAVVNM